MFGGEHHYTDAHTTYKNTHAHHIHTQVAEIPGALDLLVGVLQLYTSGAEASDHPIHTSGEE